MISQDLWFIFTFLHYNLETFTEIEQCVHKSPFIYNFLVVIYYIKVSQIL